MGSIKITTVVENGDAVFTYRGVLKDREPAFEPVTLTTANGRASSAVLSVAAGDLELEQQANSKTRLVSARCSAAAPHRVLANQRVALTVAPDAEIECTFVNRNVRNVRTERLVRRLLIRRANELTKDTGRPRLIERKRSPQNLSVTGAGDGRSGDAQFSGSLRQVARPDAKLDAWVEGRLSYLDQKNSTASGKFGLVRAGTDYLVSRTFLFGVTAQYDYFEQDGSGHDFEGRGWMIGPFAEWQLSPNVYLDVKGLWGRSSNDISPSNTYVDSFDTRRWLFSARVTGSWELGALHVSPRAEVVWFNERSDNYVDRFGASIRAQEASLGRFNFGPEFAYRHITQDGRFA